MANWFRTRANFSMYDLAFAIVCKAPLCRLVRLCGSIQINHIIIIIVMIIIIIIIIITGSGRIACRAILPDAVYRPFRCLFH